MRQIRQADSRWLRLGRATASAVLTMSCISATATAPARAQSQTARPIRYADLLSKEYVGDWVCAEGPGTGRVQWSRSSDGLMVTLVSPDAGAGSESETYRYIPKSRVWDVQAVSRGGGSDAGESIAYRMHDVASTPDNKDGRIFEGTAQNLKGSQPVGGPIPVREVLYLAGDEWYQWRYAFLRGSWHAVARRPCGRNQPPSI